MRSADPKTLLRRVAVLLLAALALLQLSASIAGTIAPCSPGDCDETMECFVFCTGCAPLPATSSRVTTPPTYLAEILPSAWVGIIPQGALTDIWRPPRLEA